MSNEFLNWTKRKQKLYKHLNINKFRNFQKLENIKIRNMPPDRIIKIFFGREQSFIVWSWQRFIRIWLIMLLFAAIVTFHFDVDFLLLIWFYFRWLTLFIYLYFCINHRTSYYFNARWPMFYNFKFLLSHYSLFFR